MALLRKEASPTPAGARRRLETEPRWIAAIERRDQLQEEARQLRARQNEIAQGHEPGPAEVRVQNFANVILAKLGGTAPPPAVEVANSPEQVEAIDKLVTEHEAYMRRLLPELAAEIYQDYKAEHLELRKALVASIVQTKSVWDELHAFVHETLLPAGALTTAQHALLANFSNAPRMPEVLRTMNGRAFEVANANLLK